MEQKKNQNSMKGSELVINMNNIWPMCYLSLSGSVCYYILNFQSPLTIIPHTNRIFLVQ